MIAYHLKGPRGLDALQPVVIEDPRPAANEVLVRSSAWSLNYRDLAMPAGGYVRNDKIKTDPPLVPLSDVCGRVIDVGCDVGDVKPGDRVMANFFRDWVDGDLDSQQIGSALGGAIDGVLSEKVCLPEHAWVRVPDHLSDVEAAALPCAAVTAWHAYREGPLVAGQTVLLLGTGGVSIFGLQLAKAMGARVIITSSSDDKLTRARQLGADETINYKTHPDWQDEVLRLTDGVGVDHVLEVGGAGTLERSLASVRVSGTVSLIGILARPGQNNPSVLPALFNRVTIRGIYVGSRAMFRDLCRMIEVNDIHPVIDRQFSFEDARGAFEYLQSGKHFGKVIIRAAD